MYSVVEISGHQYKVKAGDVIDVELQQSAEGSTVEFSSVLFVGGAKPVLGLPTVKGAKVVAKVVKHDKSRKVIIFKRKPGAYKRKNGHRQHYTCLLITELNDGNGNVAKVDASSKAAQKFSK